MTERQRIKKESGQIKTAGKHANLQSTGKIPLSLSIAEFLLLWRRFSPATGICRQLSVTTKSEKLFSSAIRFTSVLMNTLPKNYSKTKNRAVLEEWLWCRKKRR